MLSHQLVDDVAVMLVRQLALYIEAHKAQKAEQAGLALNDYKALEYIVEFEKLATGELAQLLNLSASGVSALIKRLEQRGFIKRDRHPSDRRIVAIMPVLEKCEKLISSPQDDILRALELAAQQSPNRILAMHDFLLEATSQIKKDTKLWIQAD